MTTDEREVRAKARREGYVARFFERGGKFRVDYIKDDEKRRLGRHFEAVLKIVFRGKNGGKKERWLGILAFLFFQGKIRTGEKIGVELEIAEGIFEALEELERVDEALAMIYGEERVVFKNEIELLEKGDNEGIEQCFDGKRREEFGGKSAEKWFYEQILVPVVLEEGGKETDIISQLEFSSLFDEVEDDKRRVDFFLSNGNEKGMAIEVDDSTHEKRTERDEQRDNLMRVNRIRVFRIYYDEMSDVEKARRKLKRALKGFYKTQDEQKDAEVGLNKLVLKNRSGRDLEAFDGKIYVGDELQEVILVQELNFLYSIMNFKESEFREEVEITDENIKFEIKSEGEKAIQALLEYLFGFKEFREGQLEAVKRILRGEDTIVLLPTGSGKSVIYQLLSFILPGVVIVVEPLRALMEDQIINLEKHGVETAVNLSEEMTLRKKQKMLKEVIKGVYNLIYITPERMQMEVFRKVLLAAKKRGVWFSLVALDEAHCVSEWGHDFRVSYLNLPETSRKLLREGKEVPRILALTGTASDNVLRDMERDIGIPEEAVIQPDTFDRPEMHFKVIKVSSGEKMGRLLELMGEISKDFSCGEGSLEDEAVSEGESIEKEIGAGIVFCVYKTATSEFGVDSVYDKFVEIYGEGKVAKYYGGDEKAIMKDNMRRFREDEAKIMVATKAFGMGIDKGNIRYTVHYGIANSIEAFYQEAGRAGRDKKKAMAYILLSNDYPERNEELLTGVSIEDIGRELKKGGEKGRDDINRILFLHQKNYNKRAFLSVARRVLRKMGRISSEEDEVKHIVADNRFDFDEYQKVLFRLKILDVIKDYTIFDYANNEFLLVNKKFNAGDVVRAYGRYVARYQEGQMRHEMNKIKRQTYKNQSEFILTQMEILLEFSERIFEKSRRRAILNMLELAEAGAKIKNEDEADKEIRQRILNYLGASNKDLLRKVLDDKKVVQEAGEAILRARKKDEEALLAETKRLLASYPEHPGLLLLAGGLELIDGKTELKQGLSDILSAERTSEKYEVSREDFLKGLIGIIRNSYQKARDEKKYREGIEELEKALRNRFEGIREEILEVLPERFTYLFQGEILIENMMMSFSKINYRKENLWTGKN